MATDTLPTGPSGEILKREITAPAGRAPPDVPQQEHSFRRARLIRG
ncbi:hypothetical protein ACFPZI_19330 [Streptomyces chlorus]|uniref:Uncharacterized protein n=1 Tax=Streptomyces chlorus TaxID=887452 RepID=A0ABW1E0C5_9ACTN